MLTERVSLSKKGVHVILQAAYQQVQAQAPSPPGSQGDIWLYVLPVQDQTRQLQGSEANIQPHFRETPAHQYQHQHQQHKRYGAHRSSDPHLDASSPQGMLHRLSADMSTSYHSPRSQSKPDCLSMCLIGCVHALPLWTIK